MATKNITDRKTKIITIALILTWVIVMFIGGALIKETLSNQQLTITTFSEHFIDMDGDGKLDFVINADVVINKSQTDFP